MFLSVLQFNSQFNSYCVQGGGRLAPCDARSAPNRLQTCPLSPCLFRPSAEEALSGGGACPPPSCPCPRLCAHASESAVRFRRCLCECSSAPACLPTLVTGDNPPPCPGKRGRGGQSQKGAGRERGRQRAREGERKRQTQTQIGEALINFHRGMEREASASCSSISLRPELILCPLPCRHGAIGELPCRRCCTAVSPLCPLSIVTDESVAATAVAAAEAAKGAWLAASGEHLLQRPVLGLPATPPP